MILEATKQVAEDQYDEQAAELLPCGEDDACGSRTHSPFCFARLRPTVAAALRECGARAWQTIESAPKDGTEILVAAIGVEDTGWIIQVASWGCRTHRHLSINRGKCPGAKCDLGWDMLGVPVTHWQPLPAPPVEEKK